MGNFNDDLKFGKKSEKYIYNFLKNNKNVLCMIDVSDDLFFQNLDIDLILQDINNNVYKIEIKTDKIAYYSRNIVYESVSNKKYNTKGCFKKTKADIIIYYIPQAKCFYLINVYKLKKYVNKHKDKLTIKYMGDNAIGYIIPIRLINKYNIGKKINTIK